MRLFAPWLAAAFASTAASYSFPQLRVLSTRQVGEPGGSRSDTPSNVTETPNQQATFEIDNFGTTFTKLAFALTVNTTSGDIRFRMAGPNMYSWVAFGIGSKMQKSLMFVMYRSGHGDGMTLSGRLGTGHHEPSHSEIMNLQSVVPDADDYNNTVNDDNGMFYQSGICKGCVGFANDTFDANSTAQPFIFAVGPRNDDFYSDKADAPLRRHWHYGNFVLNVANAAGVGMPTFKFNTTDYKDPPPFSITRDTNLAESAHVFVMVLTFVIIIPLGMFFIRSLEKVKIHMILQGIALLFVIIGFASGLVTSKMYNRSQNYNSAHQVIGILVFIFILAQWAFGFISHRRYIKTGMSIKWMMQAHKLVLGPLVFALGIVNIALGFRFALANRNNYVYLPAIFVVVVLLALTSFYKGWFMARWGGANNGMQSRTYNNGPYGPQTTGLAPGYETGPYANTRSDIALSTMGDPPAYESKPHAPREFA